MPLINFKKVIFDLSDDSFDELKSLTEPYFSYYFFKKDEIDRCSFLEKLGEYFKNFELYNKKIRDNDIALMYVFELSSLMKNRSRPGTRAEDYYKRNEEIKKKVALAEGDDLISLLEDETKVFTCFYSSLIENGFPVSSVFFFAEEIDYAKISERFLLDKPEDGKDKKALLKKAGDLFPDKVKNNANNVKENAIGVIEKLSKKNDQIYEPIHNQIEHEEDNKRYTKRIASFILMTILYLRVIDFETGKVN